MATQLTVKGVPLEPSRDAALRKVYPGIKNGFLRGEPGGHLMFTEMWDAMNKMHSFEVKPDDVWLLGCLKSGTTWVQEIVYQVNHNCDFELSQKTPLLRRIPTFELSYAPYTMLDVASDEKPSKDLPKMTMTTEELANMASPRHFKTHLPLHLLPVNLLNTAKVVYVARNPKDLIVSYYNYHKFVTKLDFQGSLEEFAEFFMNDEIARTPYFGHILEAWNQRNHPNLHFVFYEDCKSNLRVEIEKIAKFLGKELSEEQMQRLLEHSTFESCKKSINFEAIFKDSGLINPEKKFFRSGKAGDWKNHFSPEMNQRLDDWIKRSLEGTDLSFKFELEQQD